MGVPPAAREKPSRKMGEPNVLISFVMENNTPFETVENLFIDSGRGTVNCDTTAGTNHQIESILTTLPSILQTGMFSEIIHVNQISAANSVEVSLTTNLESHSIIENYLKSMRSKISRQNQSLSCKSGPYLSHLDELRDASILTPCLALSSLCRRHDSAAVARTI
jgi:hypothetical protein